MHAPALTISIPLSTYSRYQKECSVESFPFSDVLEDPDARVDKMRSMYSAPLLQLVNDPLEIEDAQIGPR